MSFPTIIEVAIGLAVAYYVLGMIVSFICGRILETLETRGKTLEEALIKVVGKRQLGDFIAMPQIDTQRPMRYKHWYGIFGARMRAARPDKIAAKTLVEAAFDLFEMGSKEISAAGLKTQLETLPETAWTTNLKKLIDKGIGDAEGLRSRTEEWVEGLLDQVADTYKAKARSFVILFSILITLITGLDSLEFAADLWSSPERRTIAVAKAEAYVAENGAAADIDPLLNDIEDLTFNLGWWALPERLSVVRAEGQIARFVLLKIAGLGITAAAVSQGSSFWYDVLKKLTSSSSSQASKGG